MIELFLLCGLLANPGMLPAQSTPADPAPKDRDLQLKKGDLRSKNSGQVTVPRGYALIIGISHYKYLPQRSQLRYPEADAATMYTTFINPEGGQFAVENVHRLLGESATRENIRRELEEWLPSVAGPEDRVVIYFAGHGIQRPEGSYLAPYDIRLDDVPGTAYSMDKLSEVFGAKIRAKWRVLLTDACHSGAILPASDPQAINQRLQNFNSSVFSLTASRDRESSLEDAIWGGGHGVFTYFVKQGMDGEADANGDGRVTADELAEYVHTNVRRATGNKQNPTSDRGSFEANMLLAYNPTRARTYVADAPKSGTLVIEANMDGVEVFVDGKSKGVIARGKPLQLDGLTPGAHSVVGVHLGYEPYGPEDETVYPGQSTDVKVRITIVRHHKQAAIDLVDKGLTYYANGGEQNYKKAAQAFEQALQLDPQYSRAALCLGRTYNALFDDQKADRYFEQATTIDPDYLEAIDSYAGALLDQGKFQTAVRQLNVSVQLDAEDGMAHYLLCVAFTRLGAVDKNAGALAQAVHEGSESVRLIPSKAEAHFWLAESLRMSGDWGSASPEYKSYLELSNFDSKIAGKINYYVLGYLIGMGRKTRPTLPDIWRDQRSLAYFGLCDCERNLKHYERAISFCQESLAFDAQDAFTHYALGVSFVGQFMLDKNPGLLIAARQHFGTMISLNADMEQAPMAREEINRIDHYLSRSQ